jgi:tellurite resistance protein
MGLLDRLAADLNSDSIGVSPWMTRRLVRRAVGNPLLLAGGAALAGALFSEMAREGQQPGSGPSTWAPPGSVPPPPPPPPGAAPGWVPPPPPAAATSQPALPPLPPEPPAAAAAPPLPPVPADAAPPTPLDTPEPEPELPAALLYPVARTMVAAALADGTLAPAERARIEDRLTSDELPEEHAAQVRRDLLLPATPEELAAMVPGAREREIVYRFAAIVARADGGLEAGEHAFLGRFASALGLTAERAAALEAELFAG